MLCLDDDARYCLRQVMTHWRPTKVRALSLVGGLIVISFPTPLFVPRQDALAPDQSPRIVIRGRAYRHFLSHPLVCATSRRVGARPKSAHCHSWAGLSSFPFPPPCLRQVMTRWRPTKVRALSFVGGLIVISFPTPLFAPSHDALAPDQSPRIVSRGRAYRHFLSHPLVCATSRRVGARPKSAHCLSWAGLSSFPFPPPCLCHVKTRWRPTKVRALSFVGGIRVISCFALAVS